MPITIDISGSSVTLTPTAAQTAALQTVVNAYNANQGTSLTINQWIRQILIERVTSAVDAHRRKEAGEAKAVYDGLSSQDKQTIKTMLGGKEPFA